MDLCWFVCLNFSIIFKGLCEPELLSKEATDTFNMRDSLVSLVPSNILHLIPLDSERGNVANTKGSVSWAQWLWW